MVLSCSHLLQSFQPSRIFASLLPIKNYNLSPVKLLPVISESVRIDKENKYNGGGAKRMVAEHPRVFRLCSKNP